MKRLSILVLLALALSVSLLGVTLAAYVKQINLYSSGWVGPKYFAFTAEGGGQQKSIQPGESVSYDFTVSNHDSGGTAQIALHTAISITFPTNLAETGKLKGELRSGGTLLASSDTGSIECTGNTLTAAAADSDTYTLTLTWTGADMALLGGMKEAQIDPSRITIRVSAYQ